MGTLFPFKVKYINKISHSLRFGWCLLAILFLNLQAFAQVKSVGIPEIRNYTKQMYGANTQSWSIDQDNRGVLYFGNNGGLLEFDGSRWKLHSVTNNSIVRAVKVSNTDRVYVGAFNEFGYFSPNHAGILQYHSLVKKGISLNGEVWKIHITSDNSVYFQSFSTIIRSYKDKVEVIASNRNFHFSFQVNNEIFVQEKGKGLFKLINNELKFIPGSEIFAGIEVWSIENINNSLLIGTFKNGLYKFNGTSFVPFDCEANAFLKRNQIFCSTTIGKSEIAYGTIQNGLIILDCNGKIVKQLNRNLGLQNNTVLTLKRDNFDNLWLGLDNGIDFIETNSAFSYFVRRKEIGSGYTSALYNGSIYLGTNQGLFVQKWDKNLNVFDHYQEVSDMQGQVWTLKQENGTLICGHDKGTFEINGASSNKISSISGGWAFVQVPNHPDKVIEGTYDGLLLYKTKNNKGLEFIQKIGGFQESCRTMVVENDSVIWVSHGFKGVFRLVLNSSLTEVASYRYYGTDKGFPKPYSINVLRLENQIFFASPDGYFVYNAANDRIEAAPMIAKIFKNENFLTGIFPNGNNSYWFTQGGEMGLILKHYQGNYSTDKTQFKKLQGSMIQTFESVTSIDDRNVLISSEEGFIHFDPTYEKDYLRPFSCLIREIITKNDSVIFGGNFVKTGKFSIYRPQNQIITIDYAYNDLHFYFSATDYSNSESMVYSYMLLGNDKNWSDWSKKSEKEFTNLSEGSYIFKVKARNIYGVESAVSTYEFIILPPWYRTIWAYLLYFIVGISGFSYLLLRIIRHYEEQQDLLKQKQKKEIKLKDEAFAEEMKENKQEIVKLKNEKLEIEIELQRTEVEKSKKELALLATSITRKNEILTSIKAMLGQVSETMQIEERKKLERIVRSIDKDMSFDEEWEKFEKYFDQVHADFIHRLKEKYPALTPTDLKLCAYLKMNISTKEIAPLLNISVRGVEISRYRLRKKLNLGPNDNLVDFMLRI